MRSIPVLFALALAVTACGVSKDDHQRALNEAQSLKTANADLTRELADKTAQLEAAQKGGGEQVTQLQKQVKLLTAQVRILEAQKAWDAKDPSAAERLTKAAYDAAKAGDKAAARKVSEAFDLVQKKNPSAGKALEDAFSALAATNS